MESCRLSSLVFVSKIAFPLNSLFNVISFVRYPKCPYWGIRPHNAKVLFWHQAPVLAQMASPEHARTSREAQWMGLP